MLKRQIEHEIKKAAASYPIIALTGPRQSGKTTLVKDIFKKGYKYVNLEEIDNRSYAKSDPRAFLAEYQDGVIIDEAQLVPELFSYIQVISDEKNTPGQFILTGSQNFLLLEQINQSLAGRVAIFHLLPFSIKELKQEKHNISSVNETLFKGFYPRIFFQKNLDPSNWYANYIKTYVEKDIRMIKNIHDLGTFQTFLKMCAARAGQLIDYTSIGNDCGITHNTAKQWINILEASFIVYKLNPYYKNFNKRLIKSSKLYFYDTGLLCYLLGIKSCEQLQSHYLRGGIFESFVISEIIKNQYNQNQDKDVYFFRDSNNHEIDCIFEKDDNLIPIEIKSSMTINNSFFNNFKYFEKIAKDSHLNKNYLIYAGDKNQKRSIANIITWKDLELICNELN
jgi:uncharacterized protein